MTPQGAGIVFGNVPLLAHSLHIIFDHWANFQLESVVISFVMGVKVMLAENSDHQLRLISSEKIRGSSFVGLAYQGKDIVFRFIIEYSSLRAFGPLIIDLFFYEK
jgi:hypothetical protein